MSPIPFWNEALYVCWFTKTGKFYSVIILLLKCTSQKIWNQVKTSKQKDIWRTWKYPKKWILKSLHTEIRRLKKHDYRPSILSATCCTWKSRQLFPLKANKRPHSTGLLHKLWLYFNVIYWRSGWDTVRHAKDTSHSRAESSMAFFIESLHKPVSENWMRYRWSLHARCCHQFIVS